MLTFLRNKAQSTLIQAVVILIAVVFIFWGVGTNLNSNRNSVATVNGEEIPIQDYQRAYDRAVETYRQQFGGQVPAGFFDSIDLKGQVVGTLVRAELFRQGAAEMGFVIPPQATRREIEQMDVFRVNGHFDMDRYKEVLRQNRLTPGSFEAGIRRDLTSSKVVEAIGRFALVPEQEMRGWIEYYGEELTLAALPIASSGFEDKVKVDDKSLAAWFADHKKNYATDPAIRIQYLVFPFAVDDKGITVSDEQVKARYQRDRDRFRKPEQRHARHILFKLAPDSSPETVAEKEKLAREILARAKKGEDFAALARQYSEGPSREQGGDLGFFSRGQMVPAFDKAVFAMQPGEITGPVRTRFGLHLIKLEEIRPATIQSLDQARDQLVAEMKKEEARARAFRQATDAYEGIMRAGSMEKFAAGSGVKVVTTDFFTRKHPPADLPKDRRFLDKAFALAKGELSSLIEMDNGYGLLYVEDVRAPEIPKLEEVRQRVVADYRRDKAVELARAAAAKRLARAVKEGQLSGEGLVVSKPIKRLRPVSADLPNQVVAAGFALGPGKKFVDKPVQVDRTFYLVEVRRRTRNPDSLSADQTKQLRQQLLQAEKNRLVNDWLAFVQNRAEIWINQSLLK